MKKLSLFLFLFAVINLSAQEKWFSGNLYTNSQYYVDDNETGDFSEEDRFRSNNYLKLDGGYGKFTFGIQVESYLPQALLNFSPNFDKEIGLGTFYANFHSDKLDVTVGHFYEQFGSGLILRSWEDKQLGINNALRGAKVEISPVSSLQLTGLYGNHRVGFDVSDGDIYGFDTEFNLSEALKVENTNLNVGFSFVNRTQYIPNSSQNFDSSTNSFSGRVNFAKGNFYSNLEMVSKSEDALVEFGNVNTAKLAKGNALLFNTGFSKKGFGLDATFRRIENMNFYSDREAEGNIYNEQIVNYLPSLTKQHDYGLSNIYVYQAQSRLTYNPFGKAGEIGGQFDLFYNIKRGTALGGKYGTKIALNYATWYGLDADYNISERSYDAEFLSFGKKYFTDVNVEVRKKWSKKWSSIFTFIDLFYNQRYIEETSGKVNATIAVAESTYKITPTKSVRVEAQHLWTNDDKKDWWAATVEMNFSPRFTVFVSDMYNYGNDIKKIHYYNVGGSYSKGSTRVALNYGRQRGGLLCVGGVCRIVPESTGFGLTVSTSF